MACRSARTVSLERPSTRKLTGARSPCSLGPAWPVKVVPGGPGRSRDNVADRRMAMGLDDGQPTADIITDCSDYALEDKIAARLGHCIDCLAMNRSWKENLFFFFLRIQVGPMPSA